MQRGQEEGLHLVEWEEARPDLDLRVALHQFHSDLGTRATHTLVDSGGGLALVPRYVALFELRKTVDWSMRSTMTFGA